MHVLHVNGHQWTVASNMNWYEDIPYAKIFKTYMYFVHDFRLVFLLLHA